jgi:hypothetical protein
MIKLEHERVKKKEEGKPFRFFEFPAGRFQLLHHLFAFCFSPPMPADFSHNSFSSLGDTGFYQTPKPKASFLLESK